MQAENFVGWSKGSPVPLVEGVSLARAKIMEQAAEAAGVSFEIICKAGEEYELDYRSKGIVPEGIVYVRVTSDPVHGHNQFWKRVEELELVTPNSEF